MQGNMLERALKAQRSSRITKDWDDTLHPRGFHGRWIATFSHPVHGRITSPVDADSGKQAWDKARAMGMGTVQSVERWRDDDPALGPRSRASASALMDEMGMGGVPRAQPDEPEGIQTDRARVGIQTDEEGLTGSQRDTRDKLSEVHGRVHVSTDHPIGLGSVRMTVPNGGTYHVRTDGEFSRLDQPGDKVDWGY